MRALSEQLVLVTGSSRGLGAAIAEAFVREGARVVVNYVRNREAAEALVRRLGDRAVAVQADVIKTKDVEDLVRAARERFGMPVTTLVINAVDYVFDPEKRPTVETLEWPGLVRQFSLAVLQTYLLVRAVLPDMRQAGFGRIVAVGTNLVHDPVVPYHDYIAAKGALLAFVRSLAKDLGPYGITANVVSPGLIRVTDASRHTPEEVFRQVAEASALRRVVTPEEVADAVLFFASPWARAITGQELVVDGGLVMH
ncbi:3-oxoacyl-ACP reductase [Brockia lithotrophica]|uniref:3-oxoacyl-[acyl-carrier protein] reductase n=1 Tax=Brockia lithotrophica TaxID=933949 RepID=A0A660L4E0_9BACL|nr:3-oxoacyl-ACP reductase [Brockia lithotrophica]RKQ88901.1 3-oxoacyl-[acyl-carrier protein] reductase [Brockia lithotrophica]